MTYTELIIRRGLFGYKLPKDGCQLSVQWRVKTHQVKFGLTATAPRQHSETLP